MHQLTFGAALERLKDGAHIARAGWNGKGMWLHLQVPDAASKMSLPYIYMRNVDGQLVPWLASQTDMLTADWVDLSPPPAGLALYKCHKVVLAGRIHAIEPDGHPGAYCRLVFTPKDQLDEEVGLASCLSIVVPQAYVDQHKPEVGGFYVLYTGGIEAFAPGDTFIEGYSKLPQATA